MTQLQKIRNIIDEAYTETSNKADELKSSKNYIALEYFLGRKEGLYYAIAIIDSFINDRK